MHTHLNLREIIRKLILEIGIHQFHGAGDAETLQQYKYVPGPMFGAGKGSIKSPIPKEEIKIADDYIETNEPDELIAYSRGGAMVQELPDAAYNGIKKLKYIAPAAKRGWTSKKIKKAPTGSEIFADSADSLVSLVQVAQIASEAGIAKVKIYHDPELSSAVGQPRRDKPQKTTHWRGIGIGKHQKAVDKGISDNLDGSTLLVLDTETILQAYKNKNLSDWGTLKSTSDQVKQQWEWVNSTLNESIIRSAVKEILLEKKKVKCPLKNGKRDYKCEYQKYGGASKKGKKDRAARNQARKVAKREGRVKKGDGKEIDHKKPLSKGGSNAKSNQRVVSRSTNRKKGNK